MSQAIQIAGGGIEGGAETIVLRYVTLVINWGVRWLFFKLIVVRLGAVYILNAFTAVLHKFKSVNG